MANKYKIIKVLGKGSFGTVYLVENKITRKLYAMKRILYSNANSMKDYQNELSILKLVNSKYIIQIEDYFYHEKIIHHKFLLKV